MPTADLGDIFGRIVTRRDVQIAVVQTLQAWVPTYVGELERQAQMPSGSCPIPPDVNRSYRGGLDFDTWMPAWSPIFVVVAQPVGLPELSSGGGQYLQIFDVQVACNYQYDGVPPALGEFEEDSAIQYADVLGMAGCAAILQHGGLVQWPDGTWVSTRTRLTQFPKTSFPMAQEESSRRVCRSQFAVNVAVSNVLTEAYGPAVPIANPYPSPGDWPIVKTWNVNVDAVPDPSQVPKPSVTNAARLA